MNTLARLFTIDRFRLVYWIVAIATAQHTAWGAATTMQGSQSEGALWWWLQGIGFAAAIDFLMVMVATKIRSGSTATQHINLWIVRIPINWYIITFATVALLSSYFQLLYAWRHIEVLPVAGGIASEWVERLQGLINARLIIAPLALPLIATLYTIGGLGKGGEAQSRNRKVDATSQSIRNQVAYTVERLPQSQLPRPVQSEVKMLPAPLAIRTQSGKVEGWICPGCEKELSISGWSRHRKTCKEYLSLGNS